LITPAHIEQTGARRAGSPQHRPQGRWTQVVVVKRRKMSCLICIVCVMILINLRRAVPSIVCTTPKMGAASCVDSPNHPQEINCGEIQALVVLLSITITALM